MKYGSVMKPAFLLTCLAAVCAAACAPASAYSPGTTVVPILKLDVGPRAMAMGGAYTAVADDIYGLAYNPAGTAQIESLELGGVFFKGISDSKMQYFGTAFPLPVYGFAGYAQPRLAFSFLFSQNGTIDWYQLNSDGSALHAGDSRSAGGDFVFTAGYSEKVYMNELAISRKQKLAIEHSMGLAAKIVSSRLPNTDGSDAKASTLSADFGYMATAPDYHTSFGLAITNASGQIKYLEDGATLPITLRTGMAYRRFDELNRGVTLSVDYLRYFQEEANRIRLGAEFMFERLGTLRLGYRFLEDTGGFTGGVGFALERMYFDFGVALGGDLDTKFQLGVTYKFPDLRVKAKRRAAPDIIDMDSSDDSNETIKKRRDDRVRMEKMRRLEQQRNSESERRRREADYARRLREEQQYNDNQYRTRSRQSDEDTDEAVPTKNYNNSIMLY